MSNTPIQFLPESEAIDQIVETVQQADEGEAPFALVLGSGFSHGLVPTANELVTESLPLWIRSRKEQVSFEELKGLPLDQRAKTAREFWSGFTSRNSSRGLSLPLDSITGLPSNYSDAYKAVFNPLFGGAVGAPARAREFQRELMRLDRPRLNAAHFLLASLLGVQPGRSRPNPLFKARAAFSRLILTTNFDPFLQIALQAVNRLYLLSDTPELGVGDEVSDDQLDVIHLVYLHGSIHRRSQAATDHDIATLKEKNARTLQPVLKRRGVIVLGYSGWDDAIVEALAACDRFDHRLYWMGREADPLAKGAFGPRVADILRKPSSVYVRTSGAGGFMAQLCARLVVGLPRLLANPIAQLREMLETIDLSELRNLAKSTISSAKSPETFAGANCNEEFAEAHAATLKRLEKAEVVFLGRVPTTTSKPSGSAPVGASVESDIGNSVIVGTEATKESVEQLLSSARLAHSLSNGPEALRLCEEALRITDLTEGDRASFLDIMASARYRLGDLDGTLRDLTRIADLVGAPVEEVARALFNRGVVWGQKGEAERAIADYTRVIEGLPGAPVEQVARALVNRGLVWGQKGEAERAIADYTRVIDALAGAPVEQVAWALVSRGVAWGRKGEAEMEMEDYTRVIEALPGAPVEQVAWALFNRGVVWGQKGEAEKAIADFTRVIEALPGAPVGPVAQALTCRGWNRYHRGQFDLFLSDSEKALSLDGRQDAAAFNLGLAFLACGRDAEASEAYAGAARQLPGKIETLGLPDLEEARKSWLSDERAKPVLELLRGLMPGGQGKESRADSRSDNEPRRDLCK